MITLDMRPYNYYVYGNNNGYGLPSLSKEPQGEIKLAVYVVNQNISGSIKYKDASYIALTNDAKVNDTYVIEYGAEKLKVLYIQPKGRYKQVFLAEI